MIPPAVAPKKEDECGLDAEPATQAIVDDLPLESLAVVEARHIRKVLQAVDGNRTRAAEILQISRSTLKRKIAELGIEGHSIGKDTSR